jgi:ABC-type sugar transport system substrate-binding protein
MKKSIVVFILVVMFILAAFVGCQTPAVQDVADTADDVADTADDVADTADDASGVMPRTVVEREDAPEGTSLTPTSYTEAQVPGVPYVGAVPTKKYKIAFSNGDMANDWRASFFNAMVAGGEYLESEFGIEFIYANSGADSAKQLQDIQSLLAQQPDILLFSPNESAPLTPVADMCNELGIAFITIDRAIDATVGEGMYLANIEGDNFKAGVAMGLEMVRGLTEKNGSAAGNIAEITGAIGSTPAIQRSAGIRHVLMDYPDIKIVQVIDGKWDAETAYQGAQDIFTTNGDILDGLICSFDSGTMQAITVAEIQGVEGLVYCSADADATFLKDYVLAGRAFSCVEYPPYYGVTALEYAIHYLNGYDIPQNVLLAQRLFNTETDAKVAKLEELTGLTSSNGDPFIPASYGMYDVFTMEGEMWDKYYPMNWVAGGGADYLATLIPEDPFSLLNVE